MAALINTLVAICMSALVSYVFLMSKFYAEGGEMKLPEHNSPENITLKLNDTKSEKEETELEEPLAEDESIESGVMFPTVAPATPHSEKTLHTVERSLANAPGSNDDDYYHIKLQSDDLSADKQSNVDQSKENKNVDEIKHDDVSSASQPSNEEMQKSAVSDSKQSDQNKEKEIDSEKIENSQQIMNGKENVDLSEDLMKLTFSKDIKAEKIVSTENIEEKKIEDGKESENVIAAKPSATDENETIEKDTGILESFKDWKEKQETNGKKIEKDKEMSQNIQRKRLNKKTNYASNECGAKVVASNSEAENTAAILTENKDLYMLNPCSCNIWFVVELCEKVQAERVEMANFELFSSTPEVFKVYFSSRYPTREWQLIDTFNAKSERAIQGFDLQEKSYAKFVKIEMVRHFGKEHYCPLSLLRIFGRSEVEELEDSEDTSVDHEHAREPADINNQLPDQQVKTEEKNEEKIKTDETNFLKSATNVVIGLVNKATETLTGKAGKVNETRLAGADNDAIKVSEGDNMLSNDTQSNSTNVENNGDTSQKDNYTDSTDTTDNVNDNSTNSKNTKNTNSDLVVLLEGDDAEDDTDNNKTDKKCLFNSEIQGQKCADPTNYFWIPYIFKYRTCPLVMPPDNGTKRIRIALVEQSEQNNIMTGYQKIEGVTLNLGKEDKIEQLSNAKTNGEVIDTIKSVSSTSFSAVDGLKATNDAVTDVSIVKGLDPNQPSHEKVVELSEQVQLTSEPSKAQDLSTEHVTLITKTELLTQVSSESQKSCELKTQITPDLSQLIDTAISSSENSDDKTIIIRSSSSAVSESQKDQPKAEQTGNKNSEDQTTQNSELGHHKEDPKNPPKQDSKGATKQDSPSPTKEDSHVDVLVINYDDQLGEAKAEVSEKLTVNVSQPVSDSNANKTSTKTDPETSSNSTTTVIEPSFSQPATSSFGSLKTSESLSVAEVVLNVSANQILSTRIEASIRAESVLESSGFSQSLLIKATSIATNSQTVQLVEPSGGGMIVQDKAITSVRPEKSKLEPKCSTESCSETPVVKIGSGSSGNNKESAILKLKSRVKALEANLSLSTLYLEEMSKRYRVAMEEQKKYFKAKINLLNSTLTEDRIVIQKQQKTIEELTKQVLKLAKQFENFTHFSEEQHKKMSERYIFSCTIEAVIIIVLLWNCLTRPKSVEYRDTRRHSAPSLNQEYNGNQYLAITNTDTSFDGRRLPDSLAPESLNDNNLPMSLPAPRRKRQRKKKSQSDDSIFIHNSTAPQAPVTTNRESAIVNSTAGVLFSAGRGIINGLTGAFTKQKKPIGSRQTRALIDSNDYDHIRPFTRSKSLGTIEEHEDDVQAPQRRHRSFESISSGKRTRMIDHDKRRG